jgi:hypothetical protein
MEIIQEVIRRNYATCTTETMQIKETSDRGIEGKLPIGKKREGDAEKKAV